MDIHKFLSCECYGDIIEKLGEYKYLMINNKSVKYPPFCQINKLNNIIYDNENEDNDVYALKCNYCNRNINIFAKVGEWYRADNVAEHHFETHLCDFFEEYLRDMNINTLKRDDKRSRFIWRDRALFEIISVYKAMTILKKFRKEMSDILVNLNLPIYIINEMCEYIPPYLL